MIVNPNCSDRNVQKLVQEKKASFPRCADAKITEIQRFPEQFQIIYKDMVRRALVSRFPYSIFFVDKPNVLSIFAILRQNRNPELWRARV